MCIVGRMVWLTNHVATATDLFGRCRSSDRGGLLCKRMLGADLIGKRPVGRFDGMGGSFRHFDSLRILRRLYGLTCMWRRGRAQVTTAEAANQAASGNQRSPHDQSVWREQAWHGRNLRKQLCSGQGCGIANALRRLMIINAS